MLAMHRLPLLPHAAHGAVALRRLCRSAARAVCTAAVPEAVQTPPAAAQHTATAVAAAVQLLPAALPAAAAHAAEALLQASGVALRPYQRDNVLAILAAVAPQPGRPGVASFRGTAVEAGRCGGVSFVSSHKARLLYVLPTGGGKTVVLAAVMQAVAASGGRVLFLVHRKELVDQTVSQLAKRGMECGIIAAAYRPRAREPIQVASVQTLARRAKQDFGVFDLIIVDEAHHAIAETYQSALSRWPDASLLGATATPFRLDGRGLSPPFTSILAGPSVQQLIEDGFLVAPEIMSDAAAVDTRGLRLDVCGIDWQPAALARRAGVITGDVVAQFKASGGARRAIVYTVNVEHCKSVTQAFCDAGFAAEYVDGKTRPATRADIMARVRSGATQILVNVEIATEGVDVPEFEAVLMVRPTLSRCLYLQMIGRGLRASAGKTDCLVLDHAGNVALHGLPTEAFPLSLHGIPKPARAEEAAKASADADDDDDSTAGEDEEDDDDDAPGGRQPRFGDPHAALSKLRTCALLNADTGAEVLGAKMVLRRGFRFAQPAYEVHISPPSKQGGKFRATCGARTAYLTPKPWEASWCSELGELLAVPGREAVGKHVSSLLFLLRSGTLRSARFVASRVVEQWGADVAARLVRDDASEPGAEALRKSRVGWQVRHALVEALKPQPQPQPLGGVPRRQPPLFVAPPRPPPARAPAAAAAAPERVTIVVRYKD
jgi:superfamily II DNA or RNA helicase